jgi:hypothetical protein
MNAPNFHPAMHSPSNWAIAGRLVERVLNRVLWLSLLTTFPAGVCLIAYIIGGYVAVSTGAITPGYRFLAVNTDPVFNGLVALVSLCVCLGTGSLVLLALFSRIDTTNDRIAVLLSLVGLGFGAAVLEVSLQPIVGVFVLFG